MGSVVVLEAFGSGQATHRAAARLVQLLDVLYLLLRLHAAVLKPDLDLSLGETQGVRDLDATFAREVAVELELLLEFERLVARVRLTTATSLRRVRTCKQTLITM